MFPWRCVWFLWRWRPRHEPAAPTHIGVEMRSLTAAGEERERKREKGGRLTVMTTWRAAGERPRPTTDVVFVARRPKVLNMSGVRQRLQDSLQLQIQKELRPGGRPAVHSWNESLCWEASRRQEMTLNVMNSLFLLLFLARLRCFAIRSFPVVLVSADMLGLVSPACSDSSTTHSGQRK